MVIYLSESDSVQVWMEVFTKLEFSIIFIWY